RALDYARAFELRPPPSTEKSEEIEKRIAAWKDAPLDKLPVAEVQKHLEPYKSSLRAYAVATGLERYDSEMLRRLRAD
ncbi:hypothetical protein ABTO49_22030, partial [Acinetobacter baumannii]